MIPFEEIKVGDSVTYIDPHNKEKVELGMVKEVPNWTIKQVRVVFHCNEDWLHYYEYTSQLTDIEYLHKGWPEVEPGCPYSVEEEDE